MEKVVAYLKQAQDILLLPHEKPDGDAIGSCLALQEGLRALGKRVYIQLEEPSLSPRFSLVAEGLQPMPEDFVPQTVVAMDCGEEKMLSSRKERYPHIHVVIDHHRSNSGFGEVCYIDPEAAATGEIVYDILQKLGVELNPYMAKCLFVAIASDCGCFQYSNTSVHTFQIAAHLRQVYGSFDRICYQLFARKTSAHLALEQQVLKTLTYGAEGKVASIAITNQMKEETGAGEDEVGAFSGFPRDIAGVEVGIVMKEDDKGGWRVSMRSNEYVDVSKICQSLGGGGHVRASGCRLEGPLEEVRSKLMALAAQAAMER